MAVEYFDRYNQFRVNNKVNPIPGIKLSPKNSDKQTVYRKGVSRLDRISNEYYGTPFYGWLILLANPQFGGLEWDIPDNQIIRIPFPFRDSIEQYIRQAERHVELYGR